MTKPIEYVHVHDASNYVREMLAEAPLFLKVNTSVHLDEFAITARRAKSLDGRRAVIACASADGTNTPSVRAKDLEMAVYALARMFDDPFEAKIRISTPEMTAIEADRKSRAQAGKRRAD